MTEGWHLSGKMFWRTGLPYTISDGNLAGTIINGGDTIPATIIGNAQPGGCGKANASFDANSIPVAQCLAPSAILDANDPTWAGELIPD